MSEVANIVNPDAALLASLPKSKYVQDVESYTKLITASGFLQRLQLFAVNSKLVTKGKIRGGNYGIQVRKDEVDDLGNNIEIQPYSWRFKAIRYQDDDNALSYYDPKSPEFKKIQVDSEEKESGCQFGVEFLSWLPVRNAFVTYFMGGKSSRQEVSTMRTYLDEASPVTLQSKLIEKPKYNWWVPVVSKCSTPFTIQPTRELLMSEAERFANPKDSEVETVEQTTTSEPKRER